MIVKIAHLADIHIHKSIRRHEEYKQVFNELIKSLRLDQPDRIVIVGDLFNDYIKLEGELLVLVTKFLNALTKVAPVVITRGNHDVLKAASNRMDSIQAIVESIANPKITYYNTTGMFEDENVVWCVWKHGEKKNNPWPKDFIKNTSKVYIDLFHDPVNGCVDPNGFEFQSKTYRSINDFNGDFSFFGDIHKHQYFISETKAYSGSLIAQNYSEGDDEFHGYIFWDIKEGTCKDVRIKNDYNFHTVIVNRFTDFDNLNIAVPNISLKPSIRVKWQTLPAAKTTDNENKLWKYISDKFSPLSLKHKLEFVEENKIGDQDVNVIENITKRSVLHEIFTDYLKKIGHEDEIINEVLWLDEIIENRLVLEEFTNIEWSIVKFWGRNFRNIKSIDIDWRDKDGLYQIIGKNTAGKSSIIQLLSYIQHGKSLETDSRKKFGDARFVNNRSNVNTCEGGMVINCSGEYYGIKRITTINKNKEGEITKTTTIVNYYKLSSPEDEFNDDNNLNALNEEDRIKTQKRINEIIGTYENFIRITLTTSDTLNNVLSTDNAVFLDSLLVDSGMDIFDLRVKEFKEYKKEIIKTDRISCNLEVENMAISMLENQVIDCTNYIANTAKLLVDYDTQIRALETTRNEESRKFHQIDGEISKLDVNKIENTIKNYKKEIESLVSDKNKLDDSISKLKSSYDIEKLNQLITNRDNHKNEEFKLRTEINKNKMEIERTTSLLHRHNGDIELLKRDGKAKKDEIANLNNTKICPTCGREKTSDTVDHIQIMIKGIEKEMFAIAEQIKIKVADKSFDTTITELQTTIKNIDIKIGEKSIAFEDITVEIGKLNNDKLEVEKREKLIAELESLPIKIENLNLKINVEEDKISRFKELENKIFENKKTLMSVEKIVAQINDVVYNKDIVVKDINQWESDIVFNQKQIKAKHELIKKFKDQEKDDLVMDIYMDCIHRDGIPTQILKNNLLPKINTTLSNLLQPVDFNVWVDESDLKLKMSYATHPNAVIECIGGSGKERTFSSISLKVALNEINIKSKPSLFMLDEVMGKLKDESIDEFLEFIKVIKSKVKKLIIIEQNHEIHPDYIISAVVDSNKISTITLED